MPTKEQRFRQMLVNSTKVWPIEINIIISPVSMSVTLLHSSDSLKLTFEDSALLLTIKSIQNLAIKGGEG